MIKEYFEPHALKEKVKEAASNERKVMGGSYDASFFLREFEDFIVLTPNGEFLAKGKDEHHLYVKPWEKSQYADLKPAEVLVRHAQDVQKIEIKGCGNEFFKTFPSYDSFLCWLGRPRQLSLIDLDQECT